MDIYQDAVTGIVRDAVEMIEIWRKKRGLSPYGLAQKAHIRRRRWTRRLPIPRRSQMRQRVNEFLLAARR